MLYSSSNPSSSTRFLFCSLRLGAASSWLFPRAPGRTRTNRRPRTSPSKRGCPTLQCQQRSHHFRQITLRAHSKVAAKIARTPLRSMRNKIRFPSKDPEHTCLLEPRRQGLTAPRMRLPHPRLGLGAPTAFSPDPGGRDTSWDHKPVKTATAAVTTTGEGRASDTVV